ncbi:MAG: hypothetical protein R3D69_13345 [Xanthobacteraceae bacterium]
MTVRRLLMPLTAAATIAGFCVPALAQGAFPAPLPNQAGAASPFPPVNGSTASANASASPFPPVGNSAQPARSAAASPFPPVGGAPASAPSAFPSQGAAPIGGGFGGAPMGGGPSAAQEECMSRFAPLRAEAERRANMIKTASARKASPQEACKLITNFVQSEARLISFVVKNQSACGIPADVPKQMKANSARTAQLRKNVCAAAANGGAAPGGPAAAPSLSEVLGSSNGVETRSVRRSGGSTFDTLNGNVLER